jgi:hypothetical protein
MVKIVAGVAKSIQRNSEEVHMMCVVMSEVESTAMSKNAIL